MTNALIKKDNDALLAEWQGMHIPTSKKGHNTLKLVNNSKDPNYGKFFATHYELDPDSEKETWNEVVEEVDLATAEFFPVKCRTQVNPPFENNQPLYRIEESDDSYITIKDKEGKVIEEGMYSDLKDKYKLKYSQSVYCFYKNIAYKLIIKGGTNLQSWFKVWNKICKQPQTFKIIRLPEAQNGTTTFYPLVFDLTGNIVELKDAIPMARQINESLAKYYEAKQKTLETPEVEVIDEDYDKDLPFGN